MRQVLNKILLSILQYIDKYILTISRHAKRKAFLESTILTPVPIDSVNNTGFIPGALVVHWSCLTSPEEPLKQNIKAIMAVTGYVKVFLPSIQKDQFHLKTYIDFKHAKVKYDVY